MFTWRRAAAGSWFPASGLQKREVRAADTNVDVISVEMVFVAGHGLGASSRAAA